MENKVREFVAMGVLGAAGVGVVWDHKGGLPPRYPPDAVSIIGPISVTNTTTTTPAPVIRLNANIHFRSPA
jgi:hypothetical protein